VISRFFRSISRWVFFAALVYAPWAYGGTTSEGIQITNWVLLAALILWAIELLVSWRTPQFPRVLFFLVAALICIGGWMVFNAKSVYDSDFSVFVPLHNFAPPVTGSVDYPISATWMIRAALLLGTILFVADLSQSNRWLLRLWYVIGLVGGSIALLGLLQKATGAHMIFWQPPTPWPLRINTFFATYYYHGNAGAFLNLVWPLSCGLIIRAFASRTHPWMRAIWATVFLITIAAVLANTSRMSQLIALLLLVAIGVQFGPFLLSKLWGGKSVALAGAIAVGLALIAFAQASHFEQALSRWQLQTEHIPNDARWQASRVAVRALPDAGLFGFGPGTFRAVFPIYNRSGSNQAPGIWRFLHQDYLQTLLEWGWIGGVLWALLFFGGLTLSIRAYKEHARRQWTPRRRVLQPVVIIALMGAAVHALVDFPIQIESIQLYMAAYLGLCWGSILWKDHVLRTTEHADRGIS
jgi:O-antigen ligase